MVLTAALVSFLVTAIKAFPVMVTALVAFPIVMPAVMIFPVVMAAVVTLAVMMAVMVAFGVGIIDEPALGQRQGCHVYAVTVGPHNL